MALTLTSEVTHLVLCENGAGTALHNAAHSKAEVAVVTEDFLVHFVETGEELQSAFVAAEDSGMGMIGWGRSGGAAREVLIGRGLLGHGFSPAAAGPISRSVCQQTSV